MKIKEVNDYIIQWLLNYLESSKMSGFIVGVSGGIDSAVVAALTARTLKPVLLLEMPIHQSKDQITRANQQKELLKSKYPNVTGKVVDLSNIFDLLEDEFNDDKSTDEKKSKQQLSLANTRSRLRMLTLYYYGGINNFLVTGTGNKIEDFGIGFFTKYGDGGVDISPIADLSKTQIYKLAEELEVIDSIQHAVPTDGLFGDNRSDEDQIGATYPELEWAMSVYNNHQASDFKGREREVFEIYQRMNKAAQHKFNPIPVCKIPEEFLNSD